MSKIYHLKSCPPNPTKEYADGIDLTGYDEIISTGGGSTIDVGKWLARKYNLKHTAIPTTAGTGSEVTKYCVLTVDGKKTTFEDEKFIPESYVLDPRNLITLPDEQTVASGLDAYSQALESFWSNNRTPESTTWSLVAIKLIEQNLEKSFKFPENEIYRMNMLIASNLAGRAINVTKTNVCHAVSYPLTEKYGIPHGIACGLSLTYFTKKFLGTDITLVDKLLNYIDFEHDIDREEIAKIVIESPKLKDCPIEVTYEDLLSCIA